MSVRAVCVNMGWLEIDSLSNLKIYERNVLKKEPGVAAYERKKMNILVTGSAGFVGTDLVPKLRSKGHYVIGIDLVPDNFSDIFVQHDLTRSLKLDRKIDLCIHLASAVGGIIYNVSKRSMIETNEKINTTVLSLCKQCGCDHFIFFSSINVFETNCAFRHERLTRLDQKSLYGISKAKGEKKVEKGMLQYMIVRPTNLFGKNQIRRHSRYGESHVIPDLLKKIDEEQCVEVFGNGSQIRNFLHVSDINNFVVKNLAFSGRHYLNLRSDITITIGALTRELICLTHSSKEVKFKPEYTKYELFEITDFDMAVLEKWCWKTRVNSIADGLSF